MPPRSTSSGEISSPGTDAACAMKGLVGVAALASDLDPVSTEGKLAYIGHIACAESLKIGKWGDIEVYSCIPTLPRNNLKTKE